MEKIMPLGQSTFPQSDSVIPCYSHPTFTYLLDANLDYQCMKFDNNSIDNKSIYVEFGAKML